MAGNKVFQKIFSMTPISKSFTTTNQFHIFLIFCVSIGGCLYGYNIGAMAGVLLFVKNEIASTHIQSSLFVSSFLWGVSFIMFITSYLTDKIGRKKTLIISSVVAIISILFMTSAQTIYELIAGRFMIGMASGMLTITIPLYISEIMPASLRGRGIVAFQLFLSFGILLSTLISLYFYRSANWRFIFLFELIPAIILLIATIFASESPRWLMAKKKQEKALIILQKTRSKEIAEKTITEMLSSINIKNTTSSKLIYNKRFLMLILIVFSIGILNQMTGINSILQYDSTILFMAGFHKHKLALIGSLVITTVNFISTIAAIFIVDKIERKKILRFGLTGIITCLLLSSTIYHFMANSQLKGELIVLSLLGFIIFFALSPGALIYTIISEILPSKIRSIGMAGTLFLSSISGATLASAFLPLERNIGLDGVFLLCSFAAIIYFFISFAIPNTRDKTLEEIENHVLQHK